MDGYETRIHVFVVDDRFPRVTFTRANKSKDTKISMGFSRFSLVSKRKRID